MPRVYPRPRVGRDITTVALALVLAGGATLTCAGFVPWTASGFGSTQSLLALSDLVESGVIADRWVSQVLLLPPLMGAIILVLAGMIVASPELHLDPVRLRVFTAALVGLDGVAVAATVAIVHELRDRPLESPGAGFIMAAMAMFSVGAGTLIWRRSASRV